MLFADIANFTATAHTLDAEDVYLLTDEAMQLWAEVIYEYEGTIDKFTGDGLLALFGLPVAHENDPERAVRAALEMHRVLQPLTQRIKQIYSLDFKVRIGIHTGLVIAGRVGSDLHVEYTVIGDTVNLAARLQSAAEPGTVAVSFPTYQRTRPLFRYKPLPPFAAKGKPDPIHAFRPLALRSKPGQVRGLLGLQVPMIGRKDALDQLDNTLNQVLREGHSRIALITGEAGVGKSRLVAEFHKAVAQGNIGFYQGSCMTYARSKPLWVIANVLRDIIHVSENDPAGRQCNILQAYLEQLGLNHDGIFPLLTNVLGLAQGAPQVEARLQNLDSVVLQKLTHAAIREVFLAEAQLAPTVFVFEDLHWVDPASRDFLEHLIQSIDDAPLLLILVSRDTERQTVLQPLIAAAEKRHDTMVDIQLRPLSPSEGQTLVGRFIKQATEPALTLKRRIAERAEGNPFYAEEIIRMLIEQGGLTGPARGASGAGKEDDWQVMPQALELVQTVPGTLNGLILARFDALRDDLRRTLQRAAVLGTLFPVSLLKRLDNAPGERVAEGIKTLEDQQFLISSPFGTEEGYAFRHALTQEVVYSTLLRRDRQQLHEQVAQAIEEGDFLPDERAEAMAHHYVQSANPALAIPHLITAGENAARRCAYETAIQHYRLALTLVQGEPHRYGEQLLRIQIGLGQALKFGGDYREASQILEEALQRLLRQSLNIDTISLLHSLVLGLKELADIRVREGAPDEAVTHLEAGLEALGEGGAQTQPQLWRSLIDRLAWVRFRQGKLDEAFTLASSATLGLDTEKGDDPVTLASLYNTLGGIFWQWGNLLEAMNYVAHSLRLYQGLGYAWGMAIAYTNLGVLHYVQGMWPEAAHDFEQAYTLRRENGYLPEQALNLNNLALLHMAMGDHVRAKQDMEESLAISQRLGDDFGILLARIGLCHVSVIQENFEEAATHLQVALTHLDVAGEDQVIQTRWLSALIQAEKGNLPAAIESGEQALQLARDAGLLEAEADCRRVLGSLRTRAGDVLEAEALLHEAMDLYLQLNAPYGQGLTLLELGRLYHKAARTAEQSGGEWQTRALTAFQAAIEQLDSLGAAYDLQKSKEALSQLQAEMVIETRPARTCSAVGAGADRPETFSSLPEGEWHTAAILWLELAPPADADEEAVFETLALVMPALALIAQEYQGQLVRHQNGLTVVFGAPTAYEDDTERAVQAGWAMVHYLEDPQHQGQVPLIARVAVSRGEVVAGYIGSSLYKEFAVRGEPVQVAHRVAQIASPGKVWVTEAARAATERLFVYAPPAPPTGDLAPHLPPDGQMEGAGLEGASISELIGLSEKPEPARGLAGIRARLIGRETSLQAMIELSRLLNQSLGGLIWVEGEPGIGKSRLLQEFASSLLTTDGLLWSARCSPQRSGQAFSLFADLFVQALNLQPNDAPDQLRVRIQQVIQGWPRDAQLMRPYVEALLGLQPGGLEGERLTSLEPEQLRQQTFVALRRMFKSLSQERPVVFLLDDLHWIDPISAELLQFLIPVVTSAPILFVCAQRRQGADSPNDRLVRAQGLIPSQTLRLTLARLSNNESETLLAELLPDVELPARLRNTILGRSEGNPYFIEEYVRVLIEQGHLQYHQGRWTFDLAQDLGDIPMPSSLETLIRSRIDALPADLKQLVQHAAVIGPSFETGLLEAIADIPNVKGALARLESRLLVHRGGETGQWAFNHSMIETVVYNTLLKARRKTIHLKVAEILEARWTGAEAEHAEVLAYHYSQAGEDNKALIYLVLAGERAAARCATEEARTYLEQAKQLISQNSEIDQSLHWRIVAGLGDVYRAIGQYAQSRAVLEEGLAVPETRPQAGLHRRLGETAQKYGDLEAAYEHFSQALSILGELDDPQAQAEVARVLNGLGWIHYVRGHFDQARAACEASLTYARSSDALSELAAAENLLGGIYFRQSEWKSALHHTTRAMILREQMGYTWGVASTLANLGVLAVAAGHWGKARSFFERSLALRQEMGDAEGIALAHNNLGSLARDQGDLDLAEYHFKESLAVSKPFNIAFHVANSGLGLAHVLLLKGETEAAQQALTASLNQARAIGAEDVLAEIHRIQAEILMASSAWHDAELAAKQSAVLAAETGNRSLEATAWRVLSEVALQHEDLEAAREALANARHALADASDELEAGRVAAQAGRIHLGEGQLAQAETELRIAQEIFMRLGATLDLKRVEQSLRTQSIV